MCSALVVLEVRPSGDVDAVVLRRSERPPEWRVRPVGEPSAGCECGRDANLGLLCRHADVDVEATPARLGSMERLERNVRVASMPIDHVLI
jgi:hypothetical protein